MAFSILTSEFYILSSDKLQLVRFRKELFPIKVSDFQLLREHKISVTRIQRDLLPILEKTLLKGVKVEVHSWETVYLGLLGQFKASLPKQLYDFNHEENWIIVYTDSIHKVDISRLESSISQLQQYAGRYGFPHSHTLLRRSQSHTKFLLRFR